MRLRQLDIVRAAVEGQLRDPECQALLLRIILANELVVHALEERRRGLQRAGICRTQRGTGVEIKDAFALGDLRCTDRRIQASNLDFQVTLEGKSGGFT